MFFTNRNVAVLLVPKYVAMRCGSASLHLTYLAFTFSSRPVADVAVHEILRMLDRFSARLGIQDMVGGSVALPLRRTGSRRIDEPARTWLHHGFSRSRFMTHYDQHASPSRARLEDLR
jgi:hypothetical protein